MAPAPTAKQKTLASYCKKIAAQTKLPEAQVRLVCELFLKGLLDQLRAGIPFGSWMGKLDPEPLPQSKAAGSNPKAPRTFSVKVTPSTGLTEAKFKEQVLSRLAP